MPISGYKHAVTVLVAAAIAHGRSAILRNVPRTTEITRLCEIVEDLGGGGSIADGAWELHAAGVRDETVPAYPSRAIHGSLYLAPALLARHGRVAFPGAGGDQIGPAKLGGARPIGHIAATMERFGASVRCSTGIEATARSLRGCCIDVMDFSTHSERLRGPYASGATKTALLLGSVADGRTEIRHPVDVDATRELCAFLRACGCSVVQDEGVWTLTGGGGRATVTHEVVSDSTEVVTFVACAAHLGASLVLTGITTERTRHALAEELRVLEAIGVPLNWGRDCLRVGHVDHLEPACIEVECNGFSTDAQPIFALLLLDAAGESCITDHVWQDRFKYAQLLRAMGAQLSVEGNRLRLEQSALRAPTRPLRPTDSRAAAVALLAALGVAGATRIDDEGHLDRSYDSMVAKLGHVGAHIEAGEALSGV